MENTKEETSFRNTITAKMLVVGLIIFILMIPLTLINNLVKERKYRQSNVVQEINKKWGEEVFVYGPILELEYSDFEELERLDKDTVVKVKKEVIKKAYVFPDEMEVYSNVDCQTKSIGNYESVVFTSKTILNGSLKNISLEEKGVLDENIHWDKTKVILKTTNLKGIKDRLFLDINGEKHSFEADFNAKQSYKGKSIAEFKTSLVKEKSYFKQGDLSFKVDLNYNGSQRINFVPIGRYTSVKMESNWPDPSFKGEFLPNKNKSITKDGFVAEWNVLDVNRPFSQIHLNKIPNINNYSFGVDFIVTVDQYLQAERATKYGVLIIGLTFLIFFLIQIMGKVNIHVFQYSMIGLGLTMFYILLLSISEHSNFTLAYAIATLSVVVMTSCYTITVFKNYKVPAIVGVSLMLLYSFIYVLIQLETYALLFGSIGLFVILGLVMFFSRKIEWEKL